MLLFLHCTYRTKKKAEADHRKSIALVVLSCVSFVLGFRWRYCNGGFPQVLLDFLLFSMGPDLSWIHCPLRMCWSFTTNRINSKKENQTLVKRSFIIVYQPAAECLKFNPSSGTLCLGCLALLLNSLSFSFHFY